MSNGNIEVDVDFKYQSDKAYLVYNFRGDEEWIPKSLVADEIRGKDDRIIGLVMPEWIAKKKGLI